MVSCGYGEAPDGVIEHVRIPDEYKRWRPRSVTTGLLLTARYHERLYFDSGRAKFVRSQIPTGSADIIFANDVLTVPLALALRPLKGVHADLHEYAPKQGEDDIRWRLLVGPLMNWACRRYVTKANSVSTVAMGIAKEYAAVYGIPEPSVVPNASAFDGRFSPTPVQSPLRLVHTGAAARVRKIENMIESVRRANVLRPGTATLDLVLVPGEQRYIDELTARAAAVADNAVQMRPAVAFDQIVPMLQAYDVGFYLCPPSNFNMENALPNKFFEFIQARLAIVIGPSPEMSMVARKYDVGAIATGFDPDAAAELLISLSPEQVSRMKSNADVAAFALSAERMTGPWIDAARKLTGVA